MANKYKHKTLSEIVHLLEEYSFHEGIEDLTYRQLSFLDTIIEDLRDIALDI